MILVVLVAVLLALAVSGVTTIGVARRRRAGGVIAARTHRRPHRR